jgi:hypothetical protein
MPKTALRAEKTATGFSLHFSGPHLANANTELLTECFNALLDCAEKNSCFEKGFSAVCLSTIAEHDRKARCISKAFGLSVGPLAG